MSIKEDVMVDRTQLVGGCGVRMYWSPPWDAGRHDGEKGEYIVIFDFETKDRSNHSYSWTCGKMFVSGIMGLCKYCGLKAGLIW